MGSVKKKTPPRRQRLYIALTGMIILGLAIFLILSNFQDNIMFFKSPTEVAQKKYKEGSKFRVGGLVKEKSFVDHGDGKYEFVVTDLETDLKIKFNGLLPALFREGQGVVALGVMGQDGSFIAEEILAKHDEKYMPPEVYREIKKRGYLEDKDAGR